MKTMTDYDSLSTYDINGPPAVQRSHVTDTFTLLFS